ncbi:50S ribosomal protein L4 [Sulfurovum sp.]|jgi:large subunit ribosomal protein L4|uniref:50S ribosomal protein L4 n=1 Tax=Sulfurovum sp. TaxID=1969726 RepID=UPI002A36EC02|nr:50S ribosomal protein L4 [Sulfurovum sp.]MDD2450385.1 50S ribosomal protein L4 [Sulfurovum sp.]MDD3498827.1 50S ribosomal protein L4 [Sulfurovum sp.]MDY0403290.1 50S ribosomal protein L4 [Sulfurovum sp.]
MSTTVIKTSDLPQAFLEVHPHNLYLYCKAYASGLRANTAAVKNRSAVRGGGRKPFAQKGGGRARQGSIRAPHYRGGGVVFGPNTNRNYDQKVNKKQKRLALMHAIAEMAANERLFVIDSVNIESGKTKDAVAFVNGLGQRDVLVVKEMIDDKTFLAFRNLQNAYLIEANELNAYLAAAYHSMVIEKAVFDKLTKEA